MFVLFFLLFFASAYPSVRGDQKFYRKDYIYMEPFESFFKVHTIHSTWSEANQICSAEGANIVYPKTIGEVMEFIRLLLILNGTQPSDLMLNGISEGISITFDGIPISELYSNWGPKASENNKYPFICKKSYDSFIWNEECNLPLLGAQKKIIYFRAGYTFIEESQAFYKYHSKGTSWKNAKSKCETEGAKLFYPMHEAEARAVITFWKGNRNTWDIIFIGISALVVKENLVTIDGIPVANVYNVWQPGEPNNVDNNEDCLVFTKEGKFNDDICTKSYPYICKTSLSDLGWNNKSNIRYLDYKEYTYSEVTNRCYKFHLDPKTWTEAYDICSQEQSYLAIINSVQEARVLSKLTESMPTDYLTGNILLGFHDKNETGWTTVDGTKLEDSGYVGWNIGKPDGPRRGVIELCGSMFHDGELDDIECETRSHFICEHEIKPMSALRGFRLGES